MDLRTALKETGIAEATVNSLVYTVTDDNADESNDFKDFALAIQVGAMPPHSTKFYSTLDEIEQACSDLEWSAVEPEEI